MIGVVALVVLSQNGKLVGEPKAARILETLQGTRQEMMIQAAKGLAGTPYVGGTLDEGSGPEKCLVDLNRLDCVTFTEATLGLVDLATQQKGVGELVNAVGQWRYRNGIPEGYGSRLHYASDWLMHHHAGKRLVNVTPRLKGARKRIKKIDFMSRNRKRYAGLASDRYLAEIQAIELRLSNDGGWFVPTEAIQKTVKGLETGDIVLFTDTRRGLDVAHLGILDVQKGKVGFWHASSARKKVVFDESLTAYLARNRRGVDGVMIGRLP